MTGEEIINNLLYMKRYVKEDTIEDSTIDEAIKALEQQPYEDCISRQEAILQIQRYGVGCFDAKDFSPEQCERFVISKLNSLPSVIPKEKTGKWIRWYETIEQEHCTIHDPHCKCSECNQEYDPYIASLFNYCPNCGARMEVENEGNR